MPIRNYEGMIRMCQMCGTSVPQQIIEDCKYFKVDLLLIYFKKRKLLIFFQDDDKQVHDYGVKQMISMCKVNKSTTTTKKKRRNEINPIKLTHHLFRNC